jgi:hypothetical protein
MTRNPSESQEHRDLISTTANHSETNSFRNIRAGFPDLPSPEQICVTKKNHLSDLRANNNGTDVILSVPRNNRTALLLRQVRMISTT